MNWNEYKFHCSDLPTLLTKPRSKSEVLSETAKSRLDEIWIKGEYGRERYIDSKYLDKGNFAEQDSLDLATKVLKTGFLPKNKEQLSNDWITGTPDTTKPILLDTKTSWDLFTFVAVDEKKALKDYADQIWGYMWLLGVKKAILAFCLVNTPDHITESEMIRLKYKLPEEEAEKYRNNYEFDDIPAEKRVKAFNLEFDQERIKEVIEILTAAREYLAGKEL